MKYLGCHSSQELNEISQGFGTLYAYTDDKYEIHIYYDKSQPFVSRMLLSV